MAVDCRRVLLTEFVQQRKRRTEWLAPRGIWLHEEELTYYEREVPIPRIFGRREETEDL
jgi:hypothetical protein